MLKIGNAAIKKIVSNIFNKKNSCLLLTPTCYLILRNYIYLKNVDHRSEPVEASSISKR